MFVELLVTKDLHSTTPASTATQTMLLFNPVVDNNQSRPESGPLNAKQRDRIAKRRLARQKLAEDLAARKKHPKLNDHPLSHLVTVRTPRGPDDQSLTPEQLAVDELNKLALNEEKTSSVPPVQPHVENTATGAKPKS